MSISKESFEMISSRKDSVEERVKWSVLCMSGHTWGEKNMSVQGPREIAERGKSWGKLNGMKIMIIIKLEFSP